MPIPLLLQDRQQVRDAIDRILAEKEFRPAKNGIGAWIG